MKEFLALWAISAGILGCACAADAKAPAKRVALYTGIEGVCFSADVSPWHYFKGHEAYETQVKLAPEQLEKLLQDLTEAGLFDDPGADLKSVEGGIPPQTFRLCIQAGERTHTALFWLAPQSRVPEKYLKALEAIEEVAGNTTVKKVLEMNREAAKRRE